jgi:hypothetical protein
MKPQPTNTPERREPTKNHQMVPKMYVGLQCSPRTFMDAVVELGRGDGSAAWALAIVSASTWMAATLYSKQVVDKNFSGGNFRTAGALAPRKSKTKRVAVAASGSASEPNSMRYVAQQITFLPCYLSNTPFKPKP